MPTCRKRSKPRMRASAMPVIMLLAGKSFTDIATPDGKVLLKAEVGGAAQSDSGRATRDPSLFYGFCGGISPRRCLFRERILRLDVSRNGENEFALRYVRGADFSRESAQSVLDIFNVRAL